MLNLEKWQRALALYGVLKQLILIAEDLLPGKGLGGQRLEKVFELLDSMGAELGENIAEIRPQVERLVGWIVDLFNKFDRWAGEFRALFAKEPAGN